MPFGFERRRRLAGLSHQRPEVGHVAPPDLAHELAHLVELLDELVDQMRKLMRQMGRGKMPDLGALMRGGQ